jgi:phosphoribosylamine--glycine ligase
MNILLLGSGGREHALAQKISQSQHCDQLFIAPGNAGTTQFGTNISIEVNDFLAQKIFCIDNKINMVVVGPEDPLVNGVYDYLRNDEKLSNIVIVGPSKQAAQLEGSKAFSKKFMQRQLIPTAAYAEFTQENFEEGQKYIVQHALPIVLKADGLAAGKGVVICNSHTDALNSFEEMIINKQFGDAGNKVVIEEFLEGIEVSVFVLTDGKDYQIIGHAKDYKRIGEGDTGLNTGGMGCVSPVPFVDDVFMKKVEERIIRPTVAGLLKENLVYNGFIFFGLIKVNDEPFVIEYNCRMGDPETEVVLPRLQTDLVALFAAMDNGTLADTNIYFDDKSYATVVAVSGGYPGDYEKGKLISFPPSSNGNGDSFIFHAGTKKINDTIVTNGGRVLTVTSVGEDITEAAKKSIALLEEISFEGMYFRKDIGFEFDKKC